MHIRIRYKSDTTAIAVSKLTKINKIRKIIEEIYHIKPSWQRLFYGGKLLQDDYTIFDYNIKLNDVIQLMVMEPNRDKDKKDTKVKSDDEIKENEKQDEYKEIEMKSTLYEKGDLVDVRYHNGAWYEGTLVGFVASIESCKNLDNKKEESPKQSRSDNRKQAELIKNEHHSQNNELVKMESPKVTKQKNDVPVDKENQSPNVSNQNLDNRKDTVEKSKDSENTNKFNGGLSSSKNPKIDFDESIVLYKVLLDSDETTFCCKLDDIRPRARATIDVKDLRVGQKVMVNYNPDSPQEIGWWYDFEVSEIIKKYSKHELKGTIYLGPESVPQNDTIVKILKSSQIYEIEKVVPLDQRTEEYKKKVSVKPPNRLMPASCDKCLDNEKSLCKECGCFTCGGKKDPDQIILCDECNYGYHTYCLTPALETIPDSDWYCPSCKRDPNSVVAPGAAKQTKKSNSSKRDWGRGMACVGKTKTCALPPNYFGPIPGIEVGMRWLFRIQVSETGVHRPPVAGIHGRDVDGAYSIVLSGGYEDDVDNGHEFIYTGSGGRDLSGNKRTAEQSCDQNLTRENKALARNCAVKVISESGGDAGENWREGKPVRVVRSDKMLKHFPKYAPQKGLRYDGIYKVVKFYPEKGLSGFRVWKYLLRRDDPSPAPWEPGAKEFPIVYPDGYLEAQAVKESLEKKKKGTTSKDATAKKRQRASDQNAKDTSMNSSESKKDTAKRKRAVATSISPAIESVQESENPKKKRRQANEVQETESAEKNTALSEKQLEAIKADTFNEKRWAECMDVFDKQGMKAFVDHVVETFLCIICQSVSVDPVTTDCLHIFCSACLKRAFKSVGASCSFCRKTLDAFPEPNEELKVALQNILPGYDS